MTDLDEAALSLSRLSLVANAGIEEVRAYLDAHPEAREPELVAALVGTARQSGDTAQARDLLTRARYVCGEAWADGAELVAAVCAAAAALAGSPDDQHVRDEVERAVLAVERSGFPARAHPDFVPGFADLLAMLSEDGDVEASPAAAQLARFLQPASDPDRPRPLDQLAQALGDTMEEAQELVAELRAVTARTAADDPMRSNMLQGVGDAQRALYVRSRDEADLRQAIDDYQVAADATPEDHPERVTRLTGLARLRHELWETSRDADDARTAIDAARIALDRAPEDHPERSDLLYGIATLHYEAVTGATRAEEDYRRSVDDFRAAADATPPAYPLRDTRLFHSAYVALQLYSVTRDAEDLRHAIARARSVLEALRPASPIRGPMLIELAWALRQWGQLIGMADDEGEGGDEPFDATLARVFGEVMDTVGAAIEATPPNDPKRPAKLTRLARIAVESFMWSGAYGAPERRDEVRDLVRATLSIIPADDPARFRQVVPLVAHLIALTEDDFTPATWSQVERAVGDAVGTLPEQGDERRERLGALAWALGGLHRRTGARAPLELGLDLGREAYDDQPDRSVFGGLSRPDLVRMHEDLYRLTGDRDVLDDAIGLSRVVLGLPATEWHAEHGTKRELRLAVALATAHDDIDRFDLQAGLARLLQARYEATGDPATLAEAIEVHGALVKGLDADDRARPRLLETLALWLCDLHQVTGKRALVKRAVKFARVSVEGEPSEVDRPRRQAVLAYSLALLHRASPRAASLREALAVARPAIDALTATFSIYEDGDPDDEPGETDEAVDLARARHLDALALVLRDGHQASGDRAALEEAVELGRSAVAAAPPADPSRARVLDGLATSLTLLHGISGDRTLRDEAVEARRAAIEATPADHDERPRRLRDLAGVLRDQGALAEAAATEAEAAAAEGG